jgi:molecular chaperone GrpE
MSKKNNKDKTQEQEHEHEEDFHQENLNEPQVKKDESAQLHEEMEALKNEKNELFNKLQRLSADYANFQKRVPKQIADALTHEKELIIKSLLPVLDNFEHTLNNAPAADNAEVLAKGIKITYDHLLAILKSLGVEQIKVTNEKFDPALHEAVMQKSEPDKENDIILQELQKGYKLNNRVIRPSRVVINKYVAQKPVENQELKNEQKAADEFESTDLEQ